MMIDDSPAPLSVDNLFVPPDGAIQFHLQRSLRGHEDSAFWVMMMRLIPLANWYELLPSCRCKRWFRVIRCTDPDKEKIRNKVDNMFVCECFGEVIE